MRLRISLLALGLVVVGLDAQSIKDECPKGDYACLDVINSSQCIEQLVIEHLSPLTKEAMVKCVEYEGTASNLTGAAKLCRCPGCHTAPINAAIKQMFPPPCA